jgi:hypothetical protein
VGLTSSEQDQTPAGTEFSATFENLSIRLLPIPRLRYHVNEFAPLVILDTRFFNTFEMLNGAGRRVLKRGMP